MFTNSKRYRTHNVTLRAADSSRQENTRRNPEHNRNTKKECEIFVSNLHPEMTCCCLPRPGPLLLYAFRDLWKEWGDSNFQIFTELSLEHFNVFIYIYYSEHYGLIFRGYPIIITMSPLFFIFVYISIFYASTCVMYLTSFDGFF